MFSLMRGASAGIGQYYALLPLLCNIQEETHLTCDTQTWKSANS